MRYVAACMLALLLAGGVGLAAPNYARPVFDMSEYIPRLSANSTQLPDACLASFAPVLKGPAGREGFMFAGTDGHFYFESGRRAIFWGVTIAKDAVFQPHEVIDAAADRIARAGFNLVRFHHLDGPDGLLPADRAGRRPRINPDKLDCLDYWISALKQRGIHVYIDLLSYRTFYDAENVPNAEKLGRGAKPYAVFDDRLIELQLDYARELLAGHVNPYTQSRYCDDPAICLIELFDEDGLFITQGKWKDMVSPYREELARRWNYWLRQRFPSTADLRQAWGTGRGTQQVLGAEERVEAGTVILPGLSEGFPASPGRRADARRFMADVQREYFSTMRDSLRRMGVQVPILAVTDTADPADVYSVASELDAVGCNYYFAHPLFKGGDWLPPVYSSLMNPLSAQTPDSFTRRACGPRVFGKPLVIREANVCWPNPYRAAGLLQVAADAAINDLDAVLLFTYDTRADQTRLDFFNISRDPTRWGIAPLAGRIFLERLIAPSDEKVAVCFGPEDPYRAADDALEGRIYALGEWCQFGNLMPMAGLPRKPDMALEMSAGAAAGARYFTLGESTPLAATAPSVWGPLAKDGQVAQILPTLGLGGGMGPAHGIVDCIPEKGLLRLHGLCLEALAGDLAKNSPTSVGAMTVKGGGAVGAIIWYGLDGLGPKDSKKWLLKIVGDATNTGQQLALHEQARQDQEMFELQQAGAAPVLTGPGKTAEATVISLNEVEVLRVWASDAVVELARDGDRWLLFCDTPGVRIQLPQLPADVTVTTCAAGGSQSAAGSPDLSYPQGALVLEFTTK